MLIDEGSVGGLEDDEAVPVYQTPDTRRPLSQCSATDSHSPNSDQTSCHSE